MVNLMVRLILSLVLASAIVLIGEYPFPAPIFFGGLIFLLSIVFQSTLYWSNWQYLEDPQKYTRKIVSFLLYLSLCLVFILWVKPFSQNPAVLSGLFCASTAHIVSVVCMWMKLKKYHKA